MKQRLVVHIALNAKGEKVGLLVNVSGMFIPVSARTWDKLVKKIASRRATEWLNKFMVGESVSYWKSKRKERHNAVRFQRVTLLSESN